MLEPQQRRLFLEALRPPPGYALDHAIGTTFTLDLLTLLTVPLAFTLFGNADEEGRPLADPLALLEALRRHSGRIGVFCQAGQIAVPRQHKVLYSYLEDAVVEVMPRNPHGLFHPKVWLLRYVPAGDESIVAAAPALYRLLVASRNLTFDRSWDTLLVLDGQLIERRNAFADNHPLGDFIAALPGLALPDRHVPEQIGAAIARMQHEVRRVRFEPPHPFENARFLPLGLSSSKHWPFPDAVERLLVMSPFLGDGFLKRLPPARRDALLVSRAESIEALQPATLQRFDPIYVLDPLANPEPEALQPDADLEAAKPVESEEISSESVPSETPLTDLHAKLFLLEHGQQARLWTGSANATSMAFSGNVEFLVELSGPRRTCGIDALLGRAGDVTALIDLLRVCVSVEHVEPDPVAEHLSGLLDKARRAITRAPLRIRVDAVHDSDEFQFIIEQAGRAQLPLREAEVICWPIALREGAARPLRLVSTPEGCHEVAVLGPLTLEQLTSFVGIRVTVTHEGQSATERFVLNLPMRGAPADRPERLLRSLLSNAADVLRYLLLLLAGDDPPADEMRQIIQALETRPNANEPPDRWAFPLFEAMLRALRRDPAALDRVVRLVADLQATPKGQALLPEDFNAIWEPIRDAREAARV